MPSNYEEINLSGIRTTSLAGRPSVVDAGAFARPAAPGRSVREMLDSMPDILAGRTIRRLAAAIAGARRNGKPVIMAMGAHVIKCGLSPVINDLMRREVVTAIALNGAGAIHDSEIALHGSTSEDVRSALPDGTFGMARETAGFINSSVAFARDEGLGFGEAVGRRLLETGAPHADLSLFATACSLGVPATVHAAIGTDITHMHPDADGAAYGDATHRDFRIFAAALKNVGGGGVLLNVGSAVILPEVALKAFSVLRNLGYDLSGMVGANLDFIQQYRSTQQIVNRLEALGGTGMSLTGHHEILIPLIAHAVLEELEG